MASKPSATGIEFTYRPAEVKNFKYCALPDGRASINPMEFKDYLDFHRGHDQKGEGVYSFWNMSKIEETFSIYININTANGPTLERVWLENEEEVRNFYDKLKVVIMTGLVEQKFRGGAFAEVVKSTSPLNDIIQLVMWSPVLTMEQRWFWTRNVNWIFTSIVCKLKDQSLRPLVDDIFFADFDEDLALIKQFFDNEAEDPMPIPDDISEEWLAELGPKFTKDYNEIIRGCSEPAAFTVMASKRDKYGLRFEEELDTGSEKSSIGSIASMASASSAEDHDDYGLALLSIARSSQGPSQALVAAL